MGKRNRLTKDIAEELEEPLADREGEEDGGHDSAHSTESEKKTASDLEIISREIRDFKTEIKETLRTFGESLRSDVKEDLDDFKKCINQQLTKVTNEQRQQNGRITEAESRIEELECWALEANNTLTASLKQQKALQAKLTDLESRSRRNNLRIYGVSEDAEGESVPNFVQELLKSELHLPEDVNLKIQKAHRSLAQKPADGAQPRPIIVNFLEFATKERVLREVWKKKIQVGNRVLSFDHDYATEVVLKRKEYNAAKRILKEKGVRFQTPFTRMRIHWESGIRTYDSADEVMEELVRRGLAKKTAAATDTTATPEPRLHTLTEWQRKEGPHRSGAPAAVRAKEKLQVFRSAW